MEAVVSLRPLQVYCNQLDTVHSNFALGHFWGNFDLYTEFQKARVERHVGRSTKKKFDFKKKGCGGRCPQVPPKATYKRRLGAGFLCEE